MKKVLMVLLALFMGMCLCACGSGGDEKPTADTESSAKGKIEQMTDRMAQDIASRLDIANRENPPRIFVGLIENNTTMRAQNYQVFLARLRAELNSSGARHGLQFIRERQYIEQQREREYGGKDPESTAAEYRSRAEYVLTCEIYDLPSGGTNYFLFDYQLVQLVNEAESGPNVGSGAIVWENSYEVKYQ